MRDTKSQRKLLVGGEGIFFFLVDSFSTDEAIEEFERKVDKFYDFSDEEDDDVEDDDDDYLDYDDYFDVEHDSDDDFNDDDIQSMMAYLNKYG